MCTQDGQPRQENGGEQEANIATLCNDAHKSIEDASKHLARRTILKSSVTILQDEDLMVNTA